MASPMKLIFACVEIVENNSFINTASNEKVFDNEIFLICSIIIK